MGSQIDKNILLAKKGNSKYFKSDFRAYTELLCEEHDLLKVQDIYYIYFFKFYSKLINNNMIHYFETLIPNFSMR